MGRAGGSAWHIQIGSGSPVQNWISSYQCSLFAKPRTDKPGEWDYYLRDGYEGAQGWKPSSNGVWLSERRISADLDLQLRPGPGVITIFPKVDSSNYRCILEWPTVREPGDDTNQGTPTFQEWQLVQMERRIAQEEVAHTKKQLAKLGSTLVEMQDRFRKERKLFEEQLNQQSDAIIQLTGTIEQERQTNQHQQAVLATQNRRNKQVKMALIALGVVIFAIAALALGIEHEALDNALKWVSVFAGFLGLAGGWKLPED